MKDSFVLHTFKFLIIILVGCSCSCGKSDQTSIHYYNFKDKEIEKQLVEYMNFIDSVGTGNVEYIIKLVISQNTAIYKDSLTPLGVRYKHFANVRIFFHCFQDIYAHDSIMDYDFVIRVNNRDVLVSYDTPKGISGVSPNKLEVIQLLKQNFPKHYNEYIESYKGGSLCYIIFDGAIVCNLSYYEGRLFRKEISRLPDIQFVKEYGEDPLKPK